MRVITACDVTPEAGRQGLRLLARPAPAALGVPPRAARTRPALRARRHPEGADPQRVARRVCRQLEIAAEDVACRGCASRAACRLGRSRFEERGDEGPLLSVIALDL